jgi:hypothetical protein
MKPKSADPANPWVNQRKAEYQIAEVFEMIEDFMQWSCIIAVRLSISEPTPTSDQ